MRLTALPLLAASITRDPTAIAAVTAVIWLPWLVFGMVGGAVVDRVHRVHLLVAVQLGRMLVVGLLAALVLAGSGSMPVIYVAAFLLGLGEVLADTTMQTLIPAVVERDDLERANGQLYATHAVANDFVGPPAGSLLYSVSQAAPFAVNAVTWLASAAVLTTLRLPAREARPPAGTLIQELVAGARWLWQHPVLRALLIWGTVVNASLTAFGAVSVLFALEILRLSEVAFGFIAGAAGVGGVLGTLIAGRIVKRLGRSRVIQGGAIVAGLATLAAGLLSAPVPFAALLMLLTASAAVVSVVVASLRQSIIPDALLGRVSGTFRVFTYGSIPLGAMFGGWLGDTFGLRAPLLFAGVVVTLSGLLLGRWISDSAISALQERGSSPPAR